jgi:hypothetical protein
VLTSPVDLNALFQLARDGWLRYQRHPTLPYTIWNYSARVSYDKNWNEITMGCRGLITDDQGNIIARPFPKFFNWEELKHGKMPSGKFTATKKMDGSMIIATMLDVGDRFEWLVASRGSFTSPQAVWGSQLIKNLKMAPQEEGDSGAHREITYIFELIHPENRIVVSYGSVAELVLLGAVHTASGNECPRDWWPKSWKHVEEYDFSGKSLEEIKEMNLPNEEGYVLKYEDGTRVKIKFEDYCHLHRMVTGFTSKNIWECMVKGPSINEMLESVPDEFYDWVHSVIDGIMEKANRLDDDVRWIAKTARGVSELRKDRAKYILEECAKTEHPQISGACFLFMDERETEAWIQCLKLCEPKLEQPFQDRGEA